jgi:hypothetical protein
MRLLARRALVIGGLIALYALNPFAGVAALASGFSYLLWNRLRHPRLVLD